MLIYGLADRLQMKVADVMTMTVDEFNGWVAYVKSQKEKRGG